MTRETARKIRLADNPDITQGKPLKSRQLTATKNAL
jgi:hypothetical protein